MAIPQPGQAYRSFLPNLTFMRAVPAQKHKIHERPANVRVSEIILHGTESIGNEQQVLDYLSKGGDQDSIHYLIGRDHGALFAIVPEDKLANHAGLYGPNGNTPELLACYKKHHVVGHNEQSIGIELYQRDVSYFKHDRSKLDFTDWQYTTGAMLCVDISIRRGIRKDKIMSHAKVNPCARADPQGFDWPRFHRLFDQYALLAVGAGAAVEAVAPIIRPFA